MSLSFLCSRLAFFSESHLAPYALPLFSSQGPARKMQRCRGSQCSEMSKLTPAVPPCTLLSPHREFSPVLFTHPDQHPSVAASDLVSLSGSNDSEMDDSLSLAASDTTTPPPRSQRSPAHPAQGWMPIFSVSNAVEELGLEWSPPGELSRSRLDECFLPGRHQASHQRASPFIPEVHNEITKSWRAPYSCLFFLLPHFSRRRGRKRIRQPAFPE